MTWIGTALNFGSKPASDYPRGAMRTAVQVETVAAG